MKDQQQQLELYGVEVRRCTGPRHRQGKWLPIDSFAPRSKWCKNCMRDYDQKRGSLRGPARGSSK